MNREVFFAKKSVKDKYSFVLTFTDFHMFAIKNCLNLNSKNQLNPSKFGWLKKIDGSCLNGVPYREIS